MNAEHHTFGRHVRGLRRARGLTQEEVAERGGLSADTVRRVEAGQMSPSLSTLRRLCLGLDLQLSVLFESLELGELDRHAELRALLGGRSDAELEVAVRVLRSLFDGFARMRDDERDDD